MDHILTENIKANKYQHNDAIENETTFDTNSFNLSSRTKHPLQLLTVRILGGKKYRSANVDGIKLLWDRRATDR